MKKRAVVLIAVMAVQLGFARAPEDSTVPLIFKDEAGRTLPYRQYVTSDLPEGTKVPLVLFFHGSGERGTNNVSQLAIGVKPIIRYCHSKKIPVAVIAPQCPRGGWWVNTRWNALSDRMKPEPTVPMELSIELLLDRCKELPVDTNRIYVTGISMGGFATWDILQRHPKLFAAAIPVCGGGDETLAWKLRNVPIWAFHGSADKNVRVERSRSMVSALWEYDGKIRYHEYPGGSHYIWGPTYGNPEVLDWLFSQKKE